MIQGVAIALSNGKSVFYTNVFKACPLELNEVSLEAYLIMFGMLGFDIILGMDWLFRHFTSIDYRLSTITFQVSRMKDRIFKKSKSYSMLGVITSPIQHYPV